jgi:enoyl-CoA hydratase
MKHGQLAPVERLIAYDAGMSDNGVDEVAPDVTYQRRGGVGLLQLNRPERRNAMSQRLRDHFLIALAQFESDTEARVAVLSGAGPSFCAGFDLSRGSASAASTVADPWGDRNRLKQWMDLALRIWETPKPIIAQVHGHCLAGGILFIVAADLVAVSEDCAIGWPRLPMGAGFLDGALSLLIGQRRAKELSLFVGSRITGVEAKEWGLANYAFPADALEAGTMDLATRLAKAPASVLQIRKAGINRVAARDGFREALLAGAEWDALAHADPAVDLYRGFTREHGMKAVIDAFEHHADPVAHLRSLPSRDTGSHA